MRKECKKYIERALADNENRRTAFRTHCGDCPECASLATDWTKLRHTAIPSGEVPLSLDFAILAAAGKAANARARRRIAIRRIIYYGAAAACVALACLVTIFPPDGKRINMENRRVEIVKSWDWSKFDKEVFETDAAIEISKNLMSISGKPDEQVPKILIIDEDHEQI
ncbi:MAG: hypothetical protein ACYC4Q_03320 [Victivallaceae bacterium]